MVITKKNFGLIHVYLLYTVIRIPFEVPCLLLIFKHFLRKTVVLKGSRKKNSYSLIGRAIKRRGGGKGPGN